MLKRYIDLIKKYNLPPAPWKWGDTVIGSHEVHALLDANGEVINIHPDSNTGILLAHAPELLIVVEAMQNLDIVDASIDILCNEVLKKLKKDDPNATSH